MSFSASQNEIALTLKMPNKTWKCPSCGTKNPPLTTVCRDCAHPADDKNNSENISAEQQVIRVQTNERTSSIFTAQVSNPENDLLIGRIVAAICMLMLLAAGYVAIDSQYFWGRTKYGREVELFGSSAIGMGVMLISFAAIFPAYFFRKKIAIFLWILGLVGISVATWLMFFN